MNDQNPNTAVKPADEKAKADKAAADKQPEQVDSVDAAVKADDSKEVVTLTHPDGKTRVKVVKPSKDFTNYVRGYGYTEAGAK